MKLTATFIAIPVSNREMTDDQVLVSRIVNGDTQAFKLLIRQHGRIVAHMIGRLIDNAEDREELSQDVFVKVYEKLSEFTFQSKLSTWIATIAYRHAINHLRKNKLFTSDVDEENFNAHFISDDNPEQKLSDDNMDELVLMFISQLPSQYKAVLTLYHLEHMTYPEIGDATGMPEGTVKNYLFRARALVKDRMLKYLGKEAIG